MKIHPMLCVSVDQPFKEKGWIFEVKWDGLRAIAELKKDKILLYSRNFISFNARFPTLVERLKKLKIDAVFDGEIVVLDKKGRSHFQLVQNYQRTGEGALAYYIFDILYLNGKDLRSLPLIERKKILKRVLSKRDALIRFSEHIEEEGIAFFKLAKRQGLEGVVAKKADSPYRMKRTKDWLKIKTHRGQEVVIGGFTQPRNARKKFGALLVGVYEKGKLHYAGHVGGGFTHQLLEEVYAKLKPLIRKSSPFAEQPEGNMPVTWVRPSLVCEVSFAEWTAGGSMRQPIFKGLRVDKSAREVRRES